VDDRSGYTMSNPFWDFSLATYQLEGLATRCLALQDDYGLDVNLLLYAAWLAGMDQRLSAGHLAAVEEAIADWRDTVIKPIRELRRLWHDYPEATGLYNAIKALELRAEQQQQDRMFACFQQAGDLPRAPRPLRENLRQVAHAGCAGGPGWEPFIDDLVTRFPQ
jgi:uncharacterized protein (TIGR02444 family)